MGSVPWASWVDCCWVRAVAKSLSTEPCQRAACHQTVAPPRHVATPQSVAPPRSMVAPRHKASPLSLVGCSLLGGSSLVVYFFFRDGGCRVSLARWNATTGLLTHLQGMKLTSMCVRG